MVANPLVTIITPSFNQGKFIEQTILSVIKQTYKNIEYIVVDGGSTDNTMNIVNKYRDKINIIIHEKDNGQTDAINKGFKLANGELIGWINSDDLLYEDCIEKIVKLYKQKTDGVIYYSSFNDKIDKNGIKITTCKRYIPDRNHLLNVNYDIIQQGSFYKTDIVRKVDYLDTSYHYCMDLDLWLKLLLHGPIYSMDQGPVSGFRVWGETKTSTGGTKFLKEIRRTLIKNGANRLSPNLRRIYWYGLKTLIKKFVWHSQ